ncbi:hypothetical protein MTO96_025111 [Rhipicephalus appendiculatus]
MPEAMVDGETITHEEASAPGWIDAIRRRATSSTTTTGKPAGARIGALRTGAATRVVAASRLPPRCQRIITVSSSTPEVAWMYVGATSLSFGKLYYSLHGSHQRRQRKISFE